MGKKLKFNQPKKWPLPDDYVSSIKFSPTTDESYTGKNMGISGGTTPSHKLDVKTLKDGHIRIGMDWEVYFEYYGLEKPNKANYSGKNMAYFDSYSYYEAMKEYEASKQLIEVINRRFITWQKNCPVHWAFKSDNMDLDKKKIKNNQPCKAEVGKTAIIVELN